MNYGALRTFVIMHRALLERHLALAERHITGGEQSIARQREVIARLESVGLGDSETAGTARNLLREMEATLRGEIAERKRLRTQLRKQDTSERIPHAARN